IMNTLIAHLESCCAPGATIGLLAAHGKESFYLKFGFEPRDGESLGLGMCRFI
ncbi:MAG: GNAT family N-acetyltransferase, partial [Alteromonas sp.]|nr:GNAT family N-acetyltransferase [Alteromonas sp.]